MASRVLFEQLPILYGIEKNGKIRVWSAGIYSDSGKGIAIIEHGQFDGKKQQTIREYTEGKNIGKKNETTPLSQCVLETKRKWLDKKEKENYSTEMPAASFADLEDNDEEESTTTEVSETGKYFPMLAHKYEPKCDKKKKNDIVYPCFVQPKLDGLRCIIYKDKTGTIRAQSRTGSYFETMEHIINELRPLLNLDPGLVLDGELYTTKIPFEQLAGLIKKKKITDEDKKNLQKIEYHIYDMINDKPYNIRLDEIKVLLKPLKSKIVLRVRTEEVKNLNEVKEYFTQFVEEGYEGIMLRNKKGLYRCNYRSHDLQKYKEFLEDEYKIIGFKEGDGRDKGSIIWICETPEKREFSVRPKGTMEYRRELFENGEKYIGKKLTVIYQELSELNVPRFPVGKDIREGY